MWRSRQGGRVPARGRSRSVARRSRVAGVFRNEGHAAGGSRCGEVSMAQQLVGNQSVGMTSRAAKDEAGAKKPQKPAPKTEKKPAKKAAGKGLAFERTHTERGVDPLDQVTWERRSSVITNPDGSVVFKCEGAEIPAAWSQLA